MKKLSLHVLNRIVWSFSRLFATFTYILKTWFIPYVNILINIKCIYCSGNRQERRYHSDIYLCLFNNDISSNQKFWSRQDHIWCKSVHTKMTWLVFKATILHCKAILDRGQPGRMRWILLSVMPVVQDQSLDPLASSPALTLYHGNSPHACAYFPAIIWFQETNDDGGISLILNAMIEKLIAIYTT